MSRQLLQHHRRIVFFVDHLTQDLSGANCFLSSQIVIAYGAPTLAAILFGRDVQELSNEGVKEKIKGRRIKLDFRMIYGIL